MKTINLQGLNHFKLIVKYLLTYLKKRNGIKSFLFIPSLVAGAGLEPTTFGL